MFEFAEEAFDEVSVPVQERAEGGDIDSIWHGLDVGPCTSLGEGFAQSVAVVGAICQEDVTLADRGQHVLGALTVMSLAFGKFQGNRQTTGIDQGMDFGCQPAARATHATGSVVFFLALAAC